MRFVLASASPARLATLQAAGITPIVRVSGVDESGVTEQNPAALASALAVVKGEAVLAELGTGTEQVVVACDSVLDFDGEAFGKPGTDDVVRRRWRLLRGNEGHLVTGHHVIVCTDGEVRRSTLTASTTVRFADISDDEIEAYIATGEPQHVAGGFTIDGYGAAFISSVVGDHHNVVGLSVPLVRLMLADLGVSWTQLWRGE